MDKGILMNYELRWRGPCDMSGYGIACITYAIGLTKAGINVQLINKSMSKNLEGKGLDPFIVEELIRLQQVTLSKTAPTVQHQVPDQIFPSKIASLNIGYTIFEMTSVPKKWVEHCNEMDQIWTGSEYSRKAFVASGVSSKKISVIPHIIDTDRYNPSVLPIKIPRKADYNFLSVFDFQDRKAWRELLTAYVQSFTAKDSVCLWLKCYQNSFETQDQLLLTIKIMQFVQSIRTTNLPRIEVCPIDLPFALMPRFYRAFDCYVSIAREGFGLPFAEAAASGLTVIGPEVGGIREFLTAENSYLVKYLGDTHISNEMINFNPTFRGLEWASHSTEDLALKMKYVSTHVIENKEKGNKLVQDINSLLNYEVIGAKVKTLLESK